MSQHPNAILMVALKPDGLSRKTMREIFLEAQVDVDHDIKIGSTKYCCIVMESDYEEGNQIAGEEGDLIFFDMVTYGYGKVITWEKLERQKQDLEQWATGICERHHCNYTISVTANYW